MKSRLPDGTTRIEAAKAAVADVVGKLTPETRLALRVYGHQSPTQRRDCRDTALIVPFDSVANNKSAVLAASRGIEAQGYTPITYVLKLAAEDLAREAANSLAEADAKLVVHTVGLGVDTAARFQLQCIANVARGTYFDAKTAGELERFLAEASEKAPVSVKTQITVTSSKPGRIEVKGAAEDGHRVIDAATG